ncbi:hypothetical protein ACWGJP_05655 [Microbacterium sp. NPDC055903]
MEMVGRVVEARDLVVSGEQGQARALLLGALEASAPIESPGEAIAVAEATALLLELDISLEPASVIDAHLDRMRELTGAYADDPSVAEALAAAELRRIEFVHGLDELDPVLHVEVLQRALALDERWRDSPHVGVRRAAAEAALTAQMIRRWLAQDPASIALALDTLAVRLSDEQDSRMRRIRLDAMFTASRIRIEGGSDLDAVREVLALVMQEAQELPGAGGFAMDAALLRADLDIGDGIAPGDALAPARALLSLSPQGYAAGVRHSIRHLSGILERLEPADSAVVEREEWLRLIDRTAADADPGSRAALLEGLLRWVGPAAQANVTGLDLLRQADAQFRTDDEPSTALVRFAVAARIASILGHPDGDQAERAAYLPRRDPQESVRVSLDVERRFAKLWGRDEGVSSMAALVLDRALRLSDIGRRQEAIEALTTLTATLRSDGSASAGVERAQAAYWLGRFLREAGHADASAQTVRDAVREFAADASADVRIWAANALWSAWRAEGAAPDDVRAFRRLFAEHFSDDPDVRVRRLDATRLLAEATDLHETGDSAAAIAAFEDLEARFDDSDDADIQDTVRLAQQNARILRVSHDAAPSSDDAATGRYRELRDRLYAADGLVEQGRLAEAESEWKTIVEVTAGTSDVDLAMLRLAALDVWAGRMEAAAYWEQLEMLARQATLVRVGSDLRALRVQARAYARLGTALGKRGDLRGAVAAYEALDALAADSTDGDVVLARQQGVYNRAIMLDDLGDAAATIDAYEHVVAVHAATRDSATGRLRCAKALRNLALVLAQLGRTAEVAGAHRRVLDLLGASADGELLQRVKASAFDLAGSFAALGDHGSEAATYAWMRATPSLGLTAAEARSLAKAEKTARRLARR